jgi:hypothetical protein
VSEKTDRKAENQHKSEREVGEWKKKRQEKEKEKEKQNATAFYSTHPIPIPQRSTSQIVTTKKRFKIKLIFKSDSI